MLQQTLLQSMSKLLERELSILFGHEVYLGQANPELITVTITFWCFLIFNCFVLRDTTLQKTKKKLWNSLANLHENTPKRFANFSQILAIFSGILFAWSKEAQNLIRTNLDKLPTNFAFHG